MAFKTKIVIDVEVFYGGAWGSTGDFVWEGSTAGTGAHIYKNKIVCRTGTLGIVGQNYGSGTPLGEDIVDNGKVRAVILCMDSKATDSSSTTSKSQSIVEVIWSGNSKTGNLQLSKSISLFDLLEFETEAFPGRQNTTVSVHAFGGFKGAFSITNIPWGGNIQNETATYVNDTTIKVAAAYGGGNVRVIRGIKL